MGVGVEEWMGATADDTDKRDGDAGANDDDADDDEEEEEEED
jgi:hypothetical protein